MVAGDGSAATTVLQAWAAAGAREVAGLGRGHGVLTRVVTTVEADDGRGVVRRGTVTTTRNSAGRLLQATWA